MKIMNKITLILLLFLSANIFAGYDAWIKYSSYGSWTKYGSYADYGACEQAIKWLPYDEKKCMPQ
tara:strand:- start:138 stop:332 length:195 start_codon:yes stop_codon:yes gene_type:complete